MILFLILELSLKDHFCQIIIKFVVSSFFKSEEQVHTTGALILLSKVPNVRDGSDRY